MAKKTCAICGKDLGTMSAKYALKDGVLCASCGKKLPTLSAGTEPYTVEEAKAFIEGEPEMQKYVVLQVTLKEAFIGTGSGNLTELEAVINRQAAKGYRLHTISTTNGGSKGLGGGDRIQATLVFERID